MSLIHIKDFTTHLHPVGDLIVTLAYKNKYVTVHRIGVQFIPDKSRQRVDAETHIGGIAVQKVPAGSGKGEH